MLINHNSSIFKIKHYSQTEEVGGLIIGKWLRIRERKDKFNPGINKWMLKKLVCFKNKAKDKETDYELPGGLILIIKTLPYILRGYYVVGTWHTHPKGTLKPSKKDEQQAVLFFSRNNMLKVNKMIIAIGAEEHETSGKKYFKLQPYIYNRISIKNSKK